MLVNKRASGNKLEPSDIFRDQDINRKVEHFDFI